MSPYPFTFAQNSHTFQTLTNNFYNSIYIFKGLDIINQSSITGLGTLKEFTTGFVLRILFPSKKECNCRFETSQTL
jgi:hypothetical protein